MKNTRTAEKITDEIIAYFKEHEDIYNSAIEELDNYNGCLSDSRYYSMDDLNEIYNGVDPSEVLERAFYGYDEDTWETDARGEKEYGPFNPNREYFRYNGYGNLVSSNHKDYSDFLDRYAIEAMVTNRNDIYAIDDNDELAALFNELEKAMEGSK